VADGNLASVDLTHARPASPPVADDERDQEPDSADPGAQLFFEE